MTSFSLLLLFGHGEDSLDPKDGSNNLRWDGKDRTKLNDWLISRQVETSMSLSNRMQAYQHALRESHNSLVCNTSLEATYLD